MIRNNRHIVATSLLLVGAVLLSSCQISLSQAPQNTPTLIPTGFFTTPDSGGLSIETIAAFGTQTAVAKTAAAVTGTPATATVTATASVTGTPPTPTSTGGTPTNAIPTTAVPITITPGGPTLTPLPPGARPASYTLQKGEFPYCIARRFNVNPEELLSLNGLTRGDIYVAGTTLKIPQTGNPFPAPRALRSHPDTYTVAASSETVYSVACKYGDVEPSSIASLNGIAVSATLSSGQQLKIP